MELSPRVSQLQQELAQRLRQRQARLDSDPAMAQAFGEALLRSYRASVGEPSVRRRALALQEVAESLPIHLAPHDLLAGHQTFTPPGVAPAFPREELAGCGYATSTGHIVHDYEALVRLGVGGLRRALQEHAPRTNEQRTVLAAFALALEAFARFVRRHAEAAGPEHPLAEDLAHLADAPPRTFRQGLQLVWLAQVFLHAENPTMAISFGRLDQVLWPLLERDLKERSLSRAQAFELVCAFCLKCCEGDESQNLVVGGVDARGEGADNLLSCLLLRAVRVLRSTQPSLTVNWRAEASEIFLDEAYALAAAGLGQPGFMNHAVVCRALQAAGLPPDRAQDWAVVGCYEAVSQGDCYANTVLGRLHLPQVLADFLGGSGQLAHDFAGFRAGYMEALNGHYAAELRRLQAAWDGMAAHAPSPFGSLLMRGCLQRMRPLECGGADYSFVGINILGLGTAVDGLAAIRELVFETGELSLPRLADEVAHDFPDEALRQRLVHLSGRYGTNTPWTNELAGWLSRQVAAMVLDSRLRDGVRPYPAFFRFGADIHDPGGPSPDGRRATDFVSYGVGPAACVSSTPTAVIASASHVAHDLCACGNPLALTLPVGGAHADTIRSLVETYFRPQDCAPYGGYHLHFNTVSASRLRAAQADPLNHAELLVRVSGFSAPFVTMDARWQEALIERAEQGP